MAIAVGFCTISLARMETAQLVELELAQTGYFSPFSRTKESEFPHPLIRLGYLLGRFSSCTVPPPQTALPTPGQSRSEDLQELSWQNEKLGTERDFIPSRRLAESADFSLRKEFNKHEGFLIVSKQPFATGMITAP